jgi:ribonuclease R
VRLVEAAPVAGALRFELLSEGRAMPRGRRREPSRNDGVKAKVAAQSKTHPGRGAARKVRKPGKAKPGKMKRGKR